MFSIVVRNMLEWGWDRERETQIKP